jgi:hypothetical protein
MSQQNEEDQAPPVAAAASTRGGDATLAQALQAVESLTQLFGFSVEAANQAVDAVGIDLTICYNYILDQALGNDQGGAIYPIHDCPHLDPHFCLSIDQLPPKPFQVPCMYNKASSSKKTTGGLKGEDSEDGSSCPLGENWLCLQCGEVHCSRYINGHGLQHWEDSKEREPPNGHCVAVSMADLSVWCHACSAYLKSERLKPLLKRLEQLKFPNDTSDDAPHPMDDDDEHDEEIRRLPKRARSLVVEDKQDREEELPTTTTSTSAQGYPLDGRTTDSEDDGIDYPFGTLPTSLEDVAKFIQSKNCKSILILAGAGMSVRSGIPDFRSANGLYATLDSDLLTATQTEKDLIRQDPSRALEHDLFLQNPLPCLELKRKFLLGTKDQVWKTTLAHRFVELLHTKTNKLTRLYTQNIDGLEDQCELLPHDKVVNVHGT